MRCNSKKATDEKYWNLSLKFAVDNLKVALITLNREFGFGPERLTRFLDGVAETSARYNKAFDDGVMDDVINADVEGLKIPDEYIELLCARKFDTRSEWHCANRPHNNISMREATEAVKRMQAMRDYQKEMGIINAGINDK